MAELYEKRAWTDGQIGAAHVLGGALLGGLGSGGYTYYKNKDLDPKERWERTGGSAMAGALGGATLGMFSGLGHNEYRDELRRAAARKQRDAWYSHIAGTPEHMRGHESFREAWDGVHGAGAWENQYGPNSRWARRNAARAQYQEQKARANANHDHVYSDEFRNAYNAYSGDGSWESVYGPGARYHQERQKARAKSQEEYAKWEAGRKARQQEEEAWWEDFRREYGNPWWRSSEGRGGGRSAHDAGGYRAQSAYRVPPEAQQAFDPAHHGKGVGKMWDAILGSSELKDPTRLQSAVTFMKTVGRPGADPAQLQEIMAQHPGDTLTRQMMNVLFHKFHGSAKTAAIIEATFHTFARYQLFPRGPRR